MYITLHTNRTTSDRYSSVWPRLSRMELFLVCNKSNSERKKWRMCNSDTRVWVRRRFTNDHRTDHCQPSDRQAYHGPRLCLVLPLRIRGRYASHCRYCLKAPELTVRASGHPHHDWPGRQYLLRDLLRQQGHAIVSSANSSLYLFQ